MAEEQTVNQHLPNLQFMAPLNMGSANQRTTDNSQTINGQQERGGNETALESWSSHNVHVGTPQYSGCEKAHKEIKSLALFAHKLRTPLAELIL